MIRLIAKLGGKKEAGFTLIELLVVVAIIGMLTSVIMVSFGNARRKSRDAKRLSDMQQIRTGLDLYFTNGGYPSEATWLSGNLTCNSGPSIMTTPRDPSTNAYYMYVTQLPVSGCGGSLYKDYYVEFTTEGNTELGAAGTYYLTIRGMVDTAPFTP